jgi:hypothetical protein
MDTIEFEEDYFWSLFFGREPLASVDGPMRAEMASA